MRKPISHTIRILMLLLLSLMTVAANAFCPNGSMTTVYPQGVCQASESSVYSHQYEYNEYKEEQKTENEIEMVVESVSVEGVYEAENQSESMANAEVSSSSGEGGIADTAYSDPKDLSQQKSSVGGSNLLNEKFSFKGLILPGGLIAAGIIGMETGLFKGNGDSGAKENDGLKFEDVAQYVPGAAYLTMGFIPGVEHRHSFVERSMAAVTAYGMMFLITRPVKHWIHERRPDRSSNDSFPSGHAASAFTGAELIRLEYGTWIGLGAYGLATTVSVLRIFHNRHWFNDVVAGAGVGILCARASYWLLPLERKLFGIKDPKVFVAAFPVCNPQSRQLALGCCINF